MTSQNLPAVQASPYEILKAYEVSPDESIKTSHSEIELYTKCQRAHYYSYGKNLQRKSTSRALTRGIIGHEILASYYKTLQETGDTEKAYDSGIHTLMQYFQADPSGPDSAIYRELLTLFVEYVENYKEYDSRLEILAVEQEFNIPVAENFYIKMFVDLIVREPGKGIVVWDHKFVYDFFDPTVEKVLSQLPKYIGALRSVGINVQAARYNEIRYRSTKENEEDPSKKFARTEVPVNVKRVLRTIQEQIQAARQIKFLREKPLEEWEQIVLRAANSMICRNCPFLELCGSDLRGEDTTLLEQFSFVPKETRETNR